MQVAEDETYQFAFNDKSNHFFEIPSVEGDREPGVSMLPARIIRKFVGVFFPCPDGRDLFLKISCLSWLQYAKSCSLNVLDERKNN